jgi:biopolymer transport protein ExbD
MAGSQDPNENPVAINVVPMVDVIFCLCVFFMCSFRFKQLEGKFDSWLPKNKGVGGIPTELPHNEEIRVNMVWDAQSEHTVRRIGQKVIGDDGELQSLIRATYNDYKKLNKPDIPVSIDADARIPWRDVVNVVNICKREQVEKIEFAFGTPPGH